MKIELEPIGFVRTDVVGKVPRSWRISEVEGTLEIAAAYAQGLADVAVGEKIVVLFYFHESPPFSPRFLRQTPSRLRESGKSVGVFSTRSPVRPNPIGVSVLEVLGVEGTRVRVKGLDMRDGTPILDLKPARSSGASDPAPEG